MTTLTESDVEQVALEWLAVVGWQVAHGPDIAPDTLGAQRTDYGDVVLSQRLRDGLGPVEPAPALRRAGRCFLQADPAGGSHAGGPQPCLSPHAGGRRDGGIPGGLVVDYLGLAHELKRALATYTESGGTGKTALDQSEAVAVMLEKYEV